MTHLSQQDPDEKWAPEAARHGMTVAELREQVRLADEILEKSWSSVVDGSWQRLVIDRHAQNKCAYHDWSHVRDLIFTWHSMGLGELRLETCLAIQFHDAVYDPRRGDNEEQSVAFMRSLLSDKFPEDVLARVEGMILATKHHESPDLETQLFLDLDMSILGRQWEAFSAYCDKIRAEYAFVSDADFEKGRRGFFQRTLARPNIFLTEVFRARFETQARSNISRYLEGETP